MEIIKFKEKDSYCFNKFKTMNNLPTNKKYIITHNSIHYPMIPTHFPSKFDKRVHGYTFNDALLPYQESINIQTYKPQKEDIESNYGIPVMLLANVGKFLIRIGKSLNSTIEVNQQFTIRMDNISTINKSGDHKYLNRGKNKSGMLSRYVKILEKENGFFNQVHGVWIEKKQLYVIKEGIFYKFLHNTNRKLRCLQTRVKFG